jgi:GAF domain-containing protein/HAMP domain-containing protein
MNASTPINARKSTRWSWRDLSLRTKLVASFLLVTIVPLAIVALINDRNTRQALTDDANTNLLGAASLTAAEIDQFILDNINNVRGEAQLPAIVEYLNASAGEGAGSGSGLEIRAHKFITALSNKSPVYISSIAIIDARGKTLEDTFASDIGASKADRSYFINPMKTGLPYSSSVLFSPTTHNASIYFAAPVRKSGKIIGVFRIRYDAAILQDFISSNAGLAGEGSFPVLLDENLIRLAHGNTPNIIFKSVVPLDAALVKELQAKNQLPAGTPQDLSTNLPDLALGLNNIDAQPFFAAEFQIGGGEIEQGAVVRLKTHPWIVVFAVAQDVYLAPIVAQARNNALLSALIGVIVLIFALFIAQTLSGPIVRLTQVAEAVAGGDIDIQAKAESRDEIGVLASAFNTMTAQLRNFIATLEQRVADRTKALATSSEVSRRLSTIVNRQELVKEVVNQIQAAFNYYHAHIYLYDQASGELILAGGTGEAGRILLAHGHKIAKGKGLVGRSANTNASVLVSDTTKDPDWLPNPLLPDTKSETAIPISIGAQVLGVLDVQQNVADGLKSEDVDVLQSIANQVAIALQNIAQFENSQKVASDLGVVASVGIATATITDVDKLLQEVVDLSKKSFRLYHAHIYLLNEAGDTLELAAGAGEVGRKMVSEKRTIPLESEQSLVARAARTHEGVVVNDVTVAPDFLPNPLLPETRAEMAVPMIVANKVIGVLDVQSETVGRFTQVDVNIKTTLAAQVAVAVQNARSFSESQHQAERETTLNLISQKIQGTPTIEAALQMAARELGHALGMRRTVVALDPEALTSERQTQKEN